MRRFVLRWVVNAGVLLLVANLINGPQGASGPHARFIIQGFWPALGAVAVVTIANVLLQPIAGLIRGLGCLLNAVTLGLFGWVVSFLFYAVAFYLAGQLDPLGGFRVKGFGTACEAALYMSVANALLAPLLDRDRDEDRERERRERDERR